MVVYHNKLGKIRLTRDYFTSLVASAASSCYGVAGMAYSNPNDSLSSLIFGESTRANKGVIITEENGELIITLHIVVTYGVSIRTIVKNITDRVSYTVENATGLSVRKINVYVDNITTEI